jgi:hypothetical protein
MSCWHVCTSWCDGHYHVKCKRKSTNYEMFYYAVFYRFQVFSALIQRSRLGNMCAPDSNTLLNPWYTQWMFNAYELLFYAVPHFNRYTLILQYIRLYFVLKQVFELLFLGYTWQNTPLPSFFFLRPIPYSIPSFIDVTALWCFLKRYYTITPATDLVFYSLIMSLEWDYVSELRPPTGLLLIPQVIYEHG